MKPSFSGIRLCGRARRARGAAAASIALMLASAGVFAATFPAADVSDDAYHYVPDGRHDASYVEWWYFSVFDEQQDLQAIFHYSIIDPGDYGGFGVTSVGSTTYRSGSIVTETDSFPTGEFRGSYESANLTVGANSIEVIDPDTYRIVGSAGEDHRVAWDLLFQRRMDPWFARDHQQVGRLAWEWMSWLVYMPGASVSGELSIDGQVHRLDGVPGYHDHNWGEWIPTGVLWNWAQYYQPGLAFELGDFRWSDVGIASVDLQGRRTVFTKGQYRLVHTAWEQDPANGRRFPVETWFFAENETTRLVIKLRTLDTAALEAPVEIPFLRREPLLYEQTADDDGTLWEKDPAGEWRLVVRFRGGGFKEYTTTRPQR